MSTSDAAAAFSTLADLQRGMAARGGGPGPSVALPEAAPTLPLKVERTRTFDTPEFAGMTFLEVEAKSALNRVQGMPFKWSINPYRGCSHACAYCVGGDTPILMADGRLKPIAEVRSGDRVYGTERRGAYRRYVVTEVRDQWSTMKEAYRIRLEDGTTLVASADHRFLTERGWKHVAGAGRGPDCRPHLTTNNSLRGFGGFAAPPKQDEDYRRGYVHGLISVVGSGTVDAPAGRRFVEILERDVKPVPGRELAHLMGWPDEASDEWRKGLLAALFDVAGSHDGKSLRLRANKSRVLLEAQKCLWALGFRYEAEAGASPSWVRVAGGPREHLRFFHTVEP
ncbi:MAG TPA: hypothetical protein VNU01_06920, partial [Egibacteraceae bacterium]|nr:hypothetical protein [Egibacteraceae bacterium]